MNAAVAICAPETAHRVAITRHTDARAINTVLNHPLVRPDVADLGEGLIDISAKVADPANVLLMGEHGGVFAIAILPGVYEVHTQVLPAGRGAWAYAFAREFTHWMFTRADAYELMTRIPHEHLGARSLAVRSGMKMDFSRADGCVWRGQPMAADIFSMRVQDWVRDAAYLDEIGHDFHDALNAKALALGVSERPHGEDPVHNRHLGAAIEMVRGGQARKGVTMYCRWAIPARHTLAQLVSESPPTIRFDLGTMTFLPNGDFEVSL
jgi:hypothetical protein